jgi:acyl carrier protein
VVLSIDEVRAFLKATLPNYMIPAALVFYESLPLTPTGKVDRLALAGVDLDTIVQESSFEGPRTPLEETLAQIWRIVLNLSKVGIHNNFFDLGGHSLLAVQVMSRLRDVFGIDLPLRVLFEAPTIAEMAQVIESRRNDTSATTEMTELLNEIEKLSEGEAQQQLAPDDE